MTAHSIGSEFVERDNLTYVRDNFEDVRIFLPEMVILQLSKSKTYFDVGSLCYRSIKRQSRNIIWLVDERSLDKSRRASVSNLVSYFKAKDSATTDKPILSSIRSFQRWMDSLNTPVDFNNVGSVRNKYNDYTGYLIYRKNLPKKGINKNDSLTNNVASTYQKHARIWCHCITQVPLSEIEFWAPRILHNDKQEHIPNADFVTLDDCNRTCSALVKIIDDAWEALVKHDYDYFRMGNHWVDLKSRKSPNEPRHLLLSRITSFAAMSFIAVTGANKEVACKLEIGTGQSIATTKGMKYSGLKARARNKKIYLEFGAKYLKYWKKYLDLRGLALEGRHSKYAFPYINRNGDLCSMPPARLDKDASGSRPATFFENITGEKWITARRWRPARELRINQMNDGDILETAEMQGHTVGVARKHYLKVDLATAAAEISGALHAVYEAAIKRTRYQESIEVDVLDTYDKNRTIPTGQCSSDEALRPHLAPGFTDKSPIPDCRAKETCIFCEYYGVHADTHDLKRLLSLRFLCVELRGSMGHDEYVEQWGPVIYRVDEIVDAILGESPGLRTEYESVKGDVELGYLDSFWASHLETLMAVGVIS